MTAPFRSMARVLDERRQDVAAQHAAEGGFYIVEGEVGFAGPGEGTVEVRFEVRFFSKPFFLYSFDLGDNPRVVQGQFPRPVAQIGQWDFGVRPETGERFYDGATILTVVDGPEDNQPFLQYRFEGIALTGPAGR